ncbi:hypothetical protein OCB08_17755 [Bacillus cereus]|uniref:Uncharacterized protein n=2 Tax=Bacillus cereus group TaxID=86661 RepID=A0A1C4DIH7_BACCE|nr:MULTISPECIES: hypothetical protein [Bacillus]EOP98702.1 hypothetical protein IIY_05243 [Bacillus cereus VD140]MBL3889393.1 hypothetical protein [Bacillus cereus]MCC2368508.1 hypothetical protein [Bacillus cereus]MCC2396589.1 hypothetical protein [Bacillus cereus]MCC2451528.1 hypothetical protein [Bacillus cereus]
MKKVILGASFITLMTFGGTAFAASPTEHKTTTQEDCMTMSEEDCATMSKKDCMKMMKVSMSKGDCEMSMKDCMKMMKNMQK